MQIHDTNINFLQQQDLALHAQPGLHVIRKRILSFELMKGDAIMILHLPYNS